MGLVEAAEVVELRLLGRAPKDRGRIQVEQARLGGANHGPLVDGGEPSVGPVVLGEQREAGGMGEREVGGEVLRFGTEAVGEPASEGGCAGRDAAVGEGVQGLAVVVDPGVPGPDQADVVGDLPEMRQQGGKLHAALAVASKLPQARKDLGAGLAGVVVLELAGERFAGALRKQGLGIEQVHLARTADHEDRDHRPGPGRVMRRTEAEVMGAGLQFRPDRGGKQAFLVEKPRQRRGAQAEGTRPNEVTARTTTSEMRWGGHVSRGRGIGWSPAAHDTGWPRRPRMAWGPRPQACRWPSQGRWRCSGHCWKSRRPGAT